MVGKYKGSSRAGFLFVGGKNKIITMHNMQACPLLAAAAAAAIVFPSPRRWRGGREEERRRRNRGIGRRETTRGGWQRKEYRDKVRFISIPSGQQVRGKRWR